LVAQQRLIRWLAPALAIIGKSQGFSWPTAAEEPTTAQQAAKSKRIYIFLKRTLKYSFFFLKTEVLSNVFSLLLIF